MPRTAVIDFETRAARDLKKTGVEAYVECPHFRAMCLAWCFDDGDGRDQPIHGWNIRQHGMDTTVCPELFEHVAAGRPVVAHNARFELSAWRQLRKRDPDLWPELRPEQLIDTMALARALSFPGALGELAPALRLGVPKDMEGHKLMLKLCKPRPQRKKADKGRIEWNEESADLARQLEYCMHDVRVERLVWRKLPPLDPIEAETWIADQEINDNGIYVDPEEVRACLVAVDAEKERLNSELLLLTDGFVKTANSAKMLIAWLASWDFPLPDLRKGTVQDALARDMDPVVRRALEIRQECAKSGTAKLQAMLNGLASDGRCHGLLEYHVAGPGRWGARRVQPQNMVRPPESFTPEDAEEVLAWLALA